MSKVVPLRPPQATGASGIPILRPRKVAATRSYFSSATADDIATTAVVSNGVGVMPPPLAYLPAIALLTEIIKEFGQIRTKLRSPMCHSKSQHIQDQRKIFREWMQRDFSASFSLKAL
ncbi:hypothetical protein FF1_022096 [Malus domestica]